MLTVATGTLKSHRVIYYVAVRDPQGVRICYLGQYIRRKPTVYSLPAILNEKTCSDHMLYISYRHMS